MDKNLGDIKKLFSQLGLKLTMHRLVVLEYLMNTYTHPSAEMIYNALKERYPTITLSTIYNTLEVFVEKGLIKKIPTFSGTARYDANIKPHIHIINKQTDEIKDLYDEQLLNDLQKHLAEKYNLKDINPNNIEIVITQQ